MLLEQKEMILDRSQPYLLRDLTQRCAMAKYNQRKSALFHIRYPTM